MELPAWLLAAWESSRPFVEPLMFWRGFEGEMQTLLIYAVGIAVYTALVFSFYQNLSQRNAFSFKRRGGFWGGMVLFLENTLVFPLMSFLFFVVLSVALFVLAKSQTTFQILVLSMSVVVGVRVTAFVSESAAVDLAKTLPLALLGVLIVDPTYARLETTLMRLVEAPSLFPIVWRFFVLFIVIEGVMRVGHSVLRRTRDPFGPSERTHKTRAQLANEQQRRLHVVEQRPPEQK